jgi:hypothetical protein
MDDGKRQILERVARGELAPEEAAARLEELERDEPAALDQPDALRPAPPVGTDAAIRRIKVISEFGPVQVIGDGSVREAVAEGPHLVRREDGRLVIEHNAEGGDFFFSRPGHASFRGGHRPQRLVVRMNPALPLEMASTAGTIRIRDLTGPIQASVQAGSTVIDGFRGPLNLTSAAGSIRARGTLTEGESRISCQAGSVRIQLERGSSVRVRARAQLGRVRIDGSKRGQSLGFGDGDEVTIGEGKASLNIDATMGTIRVDAS